MKKILLFSYFVVFSFTVVLGQSKEQIEKITAYESNYKVDGESVIFSKVLDNVKGSQDDLYTRALSYFATAYNSANDVIQMKDKEAGTVIGRGIFTIHKKENMISFEQVKCTHTLRIDLKEGRARLLLTVDLYDIEIGKDKPTKLKMPIVSTYPIAEKPQGSKKTYADYFIKLNEKVIETFAEIEKELNAETAGASADW